MAILNKTGITTGNTIEAEHVTRTIDALTGVSTDTIKATGSFSGSFVGSFSGSLVGVITSASYALTSSHTVTALAAIGANSAVSSSFATTAVTASIALHAVSSSFANTASFLLGSINSSISASHATRASSSIVIRSTANSTFYPVLASTSPTTFNSASLSTTSTTITINPSLGRITATQFTGSLFGTASRAVSSSIAQKGGDDQATLTFIHLPVADLLMANADTIGGYPILPVNSGEAIVGLHMPFTGLIVSASFSSYCENPGDIDEKVFLRLLIDGADAVGLGYIYVDTYLDSGSVAVNTQATKGQRLAIRLEPTIDGNATNWVTNTILTVRK